MSLLSMTAVARRGAPDPLNGAVLAFGAFATAAQVILARELLVVFSGNEIAIAAVLAAWLLGIGLGALLARGLAGAGASRARLAGGAAAVLAAMTAALPAAVWAARGLRLLLRLPAGTPASGEAILAGSFLLCLPLSAGVGLAFPVACRIAAAARADGGGGEPASGRVYAIDAAGSMLGGLLLSFALLPHVSALRAVAAAVAAGAAAAALFARCAAEPGARRGAARPAAFAAWAVTLTALLCCLFAPPAFERVERCLAEKRWRAFGVLPREPGAPGLRLVASRDTRYQSLALLDDRGQYALYGNGEVLLTFPDPATYEFAVHAAMAQHPRPRRVLCLGGNPLGDLPELLKYPLERLVFVELDPGIPRMLEAALPEALRRVRTDARLEEVLDDGPRYVRRCAQRFDVVFVNAPDPSTGAANRFYTREFYAGLRRLLRPGGVVCAAVSSSERLERRAAELGASVYQTLASVFPRVLVTAGSRNRFFAAVETGEPRAAGEPGITLDRRVLVARSHAAAVPAQYFRPEYFLAADEIDPDQVRRVVARFTARPVPLNSDLRPITTFHTLQLWIESSGSRLGRVLDACRGATVPGLALAALAGGLLLAGGGAVLRRLPRGSGPERVRRGYGRWMVGLLLAGTGFYGMAAEVAVLGLFQSRFGYVYARVGVIVAMFMGGLALGAVSGRRLARGGAGREALGLAGVEGAMLLLAAVLPPLAFGADRVWPAAWPDGLLEAFFYAAMAAAGWGVGAEFPLGVALFQRWGGSARSATALAWAADHLGAALGGLLAGVLLIPILGLTATCAVLAALKGAGLLVLAGAWAAAGSGERSTPNVRNCSATPTQKRESVHD